MKYSEKLSTILLIIDEARSIAPQGKPCRINAVATIYSVINPHDTAYIFEKLEKDQKVLKIISMPPQTAEDEVIRTLDPDADCYVFDVLPTFDTYFDVINNSQTKPVELMARPKFDAKESKIVFNSKECFIALGTIQFYLCEAVFADFGSKIAEIDIIDSAGKSDKKTTIYDAHRLLNKKVEETLGIKRLFEYAAGHVWIRKELFSEQ